jgi:magnesium transporter
VFRGTEYKRFNVRTLYKHVIKAIRYESTKHVRNERTTIDHMVLARATSGGAQVPAAVEGTINQVDERVQVLDPLIAEPSSLPPGESPRNQEQTGQVTWRERLGGFLHPRDMRKLVSPFSASNEPELIVRRHAILLNFDPLRAIVLRDRAIVLVPDGADSLLVQLEKRIRGEPHGMFNERQTTELTGNDSSPELDKLNVKRPLDGSSEGDGNETLGMEEEEDVGDFLLGSEWAELDGKEWIDLPFELQCVDAVLSSVSAILADEVLELQVGANGVISDLIRPDADVGDSAQEMLRTLKNVVREMTSRVEGFNRAMDTLLDDYEDMALMNLSRLLTHPERFVQPVPQAVLEEESDEPELILEAHLQRGHTLVNALSLVAGHITSTEDFAVRRSDTIRNRILYMDLVISILTLCVTIGSLVGSLFGMNVPNSYEDSHNAFKIIVYTTICGFCCIAMVMLLTLRNMGTLSNVSLRT